MRSRLFSSLAFVLFSPSCFSGYADAQIWTFTHLAGGDGGHDAVDGAGPAARLHSPSGVALDAQGWLYVADALNHTIRRISPAGEVSTLAGLPGVAGSADGPAGVARFNRPFGVAVDRTGTVYVADSRNHSVRAITPNGTVSTLAGRAGEPGSKDGMGGEARFRSPFAVAVDRDGKVWVADYDNDSIRTIAPDGRVTTLAGQACAPGFVDGVGNAARFNHPTAIAFEPSGDALVADGTNYAIRRVTREGIVTTLLGGSPTQGFCPGIATDALGNAYILNRGRLSVLKRTPAGEITVLAGNSTSWGSRDGRGSDARFFSPRLLAVDRWGSAYVPDNGNQVIRKITPDGVVTTLAGRPEPAEAPTAWAARHSSIRRTELRSTAPATSSFRTTSARSFAESPRTGTSAPWPERPSSGTTSMEQAKRRDSISRPESRSMPPETYSSPTPGIRRSGS